jgi:6,7-dimethyl-8-ribityllumazine synthase
MHFEYIADAVSHGLMRRSWPGAGRRRRGCEVVLVKAMDIDTVHSIQYICILAAGVLEENITVQTVPGSYELPLAVQR